MPRSQHSDSGSPSRSRSRSRSPSPSRRKIDSAGRSYSDNETDYSDESFTSEDEAKKSKAKKNGPGNSNLTKKNVNRAYGKRGGKGGNAGGRTSKASKMTGSNTARENDNVTRRVLSARRLKVNELRNQVESLTTQLREVQQENKALKRQNILQDKALDKYEYRENDMPSIISRHAEEVRVLKEQLRKQKEKQAKADSKLKDSQADLSKAQRQVKKLRDIVDKKDLGERDEMSRKMTSMENELEDSRKRVSELERYTANLQKNHKHELGITRAKQKEDTKQMQELQENYRKLETALREKEKELEVRNIYAQRVMKPPHKLNSGVNSVRSTPAPSSQRSVPHSPRQDKKERRRREKQNSPGTEQKSPSLPLPAICGPPAPDEKKNEAAEVPEWQHAFLTQSQNQTEEESRRGEAEDEDNMIADRDAMKRDAERRSTEERRYREDLESKRKEDDEGYQRRKEQEEKERREEEERGDRRDEEDRRERGEKQRRERQERDKKDQEDMEEKMRNAREEAAQLANSDAQQERQRQKAMLLAKMKEIDDGKKSDTTISPSHRKYPFTKPVENMHNGLPSTEEYGFAGRGRRRRSQDSDSDNGYKPSTYDRNAKRSFLNGSDSDGSPKHKPKGNTKKTNLMSNLFGNDAKSDNKKTDFDNSFFGDFKPSRPNEKRRGQDTASGPGLFEINDNNSRPGSGNLLPRRTRNNPTTFGNHPTINAIGDMEDDLEEVML